MYSYKGKKSDWSLENVNRLKEDLLIVYIDVL